MIKTDRQGAKPSAGPLFCVKGQATPSIASAASMPTTPQRMVMELMQLARPPSPPHLAVKAGEITEAGANTITASTCRISSGSGAKW